MGFVFTVWCNALQVIGIDDPGAPPCHLLKVGRRVDVPHEKKTLQGLHIGSSRNHVHSDSNTGVVRVAERGEQVFRFGPRRPVGDLHRKLVPLPKLLPDDLDAVISLGVAFGEDQRVGDLCTSSEDLLEEPTLE